MNNLIAFVNQFMEYFIVFIVSITAILAGCFVGIKWRKSKDLKQQMISSAEADIKV